MLAGDIEILARHLAGRKKIVSLLLQFRFQPVQRRQFRRTGRKAFRQTAIGCQQRVSSLPQALRRQAVFQFENRSIKRADNAGQRIVRQGLVVSIEQSVLVAAPPPDAVEPGATRPVSLLAATGARIAPEDFLDLLAAAFARREAEFTTYGFAPIRNAWLAGAARLGTEITARTGNSAITGIFETVDEQGCLVLKASDGRHRIAAADVFF